MIITTFLCSDGTGGYQTKSALHLNSGSGLFLNEAPAIKPCLEIVSAGTDEQGATVENFVSRRVSLSVFGMINPNLEPIFLGIDNVTVRATG